MILLQCKYFIGAGKCLVTEAGSRLGNIASIYLHGAATCSPPLLLCSGVELELRGTARGMRCAEGSCLRAEGRLLRGAPRGWGAPGAGQGLRVPGDVAGGTRGPERGTAEVGASGEMVIGKENCIPLQVGVFFL